MKKEKLRRNILLKNYTTFKIGGPAKYFFEARNKEELIKAIKTAQELRLDFFILGGGGNILVSDGGFQGLVIKMKNDKLKIKNYNAKLKIYCESGLSLANLLSRSLENRATGLEWAAGIPGTVGGAIRGNAGAFNQSISDITKTVTVLEIPNSKSLPFYGIPQGGKVPIKSQITNPKPRIKILNNKSCKFKYRDSVFKKNKNLIIISAELEMKKDDKKEIRKKIMEILKWRKDHQPLEYPSAGSIFKNPEKYSAGWLIEQCGLKGKKINDAQISQKHANFIINLGRAKAEDVKKLINLAKKRVKEKFNIILEEEIKYLE